MDALSYPSHLLPAKGRLAARLVDGVQVFGEFCQRPGAIVQPASYTGKCYVPRPVGYGRSRESALQGFPALFGLPVSVWGASSHSYPFYSDSSPGPLSLTD